MICYTSCDDKIHMPMIAALCNMGGICACRIQCLIESYGRYENLLQLWVQYDGVNNPTAAAAKYGADMTVLLTDKADIAEIREFVGAVCAASVTSERQIFDGSESGIVMRLYGKSYWQYPGKGISIDFSPELNAVHKLLEQCRGESFVCPSYEDFILDTSHKLRHGCACCCAVIHDGIPISYAMTAAMTDSSAIIGAVCTHPDFRKQGYGSLCVGSLIEKLDGREILLMRANGENEKFYQKLGFENSGKFYQ